MPPLRKSKPLAALILMRHSTLHSPAMRGCVVLVVAMLPLWSAQAADVPASPLPAARCEADYGGRTERLTLQPTTDVYATQSFTLGNRFRFQAQYLPQRAKLKTWVYELRERGPLLLHAAEYPLPANACSAGNPSAIHFGLNKVYSSDFERELFFHCSGSCE